MFKRALIGLVLVAVLNMSLSCHRTVAVAPEEATRTEEKIIKVATVDGRVLVFDDLGGRYLPARNAVAGFTVTEDSTTYEGRPATTKEFVSVVIPIDSLIQIWVRKSDPVRTVVAVIGVAAAIGLMTLLVAAALKESCPFVYSFDGQSFAFDAEPLGGAICEGLKRSESSRLDYVQPVDGQYRIKFRNEVPEIQYIDGVSLLVADYPTGALIVPDTAGRLHVIEQAIPTLSAVDENGASIVSFIEDRDGLVWQTQMTNASLADDTSNRHQLTFEFPKPPDARTARIIINAGTAIWGSNMIREMLQLRGDGVADWYQSVNQLGADAMDLLRFNLREEMYVLKLQVLKESMFEARTLIWGGGPFVTEDRVYEIDVADLAGDKLVLRVDPPKGFWTIDYLSVDYDQHDCVAPVESELISAMDDRQQCIKELVSVTDSRYYVMETVGEEAEIVFNAPPQAQGLKRSVFLRTTGYYEVQTDTSAPEQSALVSYLMNEPGAILSYAQSRYREWYDEVALANWKRAKLRE